MRDSGVFRFSDQPAAMTIGGGIRDAWEFLGQTWRKWLPAVLALAVAQSLMYLVLNPNLNGIVSYHPSTGQYVFSDDAFQRLLPFLMSLLARLVLAAVAGWFFLATAIGGLRNRQFGLPETVDRGLWVLWAGFLLGVALAAGVILVGIEFLVAPPLGILWGLVVTVVATVVGVRLSFYALAIFDGFGPVGAFRESWRLSKRSFLRLFGWGAAAVAIGIVLSILAGIATGVLPIPVVLVQGVNGIAAAISSCYSVFLMAVLYESQRARLDPALDEPSTPSVLPEPHR